MKEKINHPNHYNIQGGLECIDEMLLIFGKEAVINFCMLNVWKYRYRAGLKGKKKEDIEKSNWYLRKIKSLKED